MKQAGIYIHIPFCRARCSYCDFATCGYDADESERYVAAVCREIESSQLPQGDPVVDTIYFGGGTPSLLKPEQLARLLDAVRRRFGTDEFDEITIEVDPGTASLETLREFRLLGIDRASFGVQTFSDGELRRLNRRHTAADARRTFDDLCSVGFTNISLDLIAGLPAQTVAAFSRNLEEAFRLHPTHLSFYILELHESTSLAHLIRRGRVPVPDEDAAAEMYVLLCDQAAEAGYAHYEISNFCLPNFEARHNTKYWTRAPVFGYGCSAHSFDGASARWHNEPDARAYVKLVESGASPVVETQVLALGDIAAENLFLGLRLMRGLDLDRHQAMFGKDVRGEREAGMTRLREAGLIELDGGLLRLTTRGALLSNEVFAALC